MAPIRRPRKIEDVESTARRAAGAAGLFLLCAAPAAAQQVATGAAPAVRIAVRTGRVVLHTWNRDTVAVTGGEDVTVRRFGSAAVDRVLAGGTVGIPFAQVVTQRGVVLLPPEEFSVPPIAPTEGVQIFIDGASAQSTVDVTVPASAPFVYAAVQRGQLRIEHYGGTIVALVHTGAIAAQRLTGNAYLEAVHGAVVVRNSDFTHVRARTAVGPVLFERCSSAQIEASSVNGTVAYDDGRFRPGLARFESLNGDVILGVAAGSTARIAAHSAMGEIYQETGRSPSFKTSGDDAQSEFGGPGGPLVTASSQGGAVLIYDGRFAQHPALRARIAPRFNKPFSRRIFGNQQGRGRLPRRSPPR